MIAAAVRPGPPPDTIRRTARRADELRYASLWTFQRLLYEQHGVVDGMR